MKTMYCLGEGYPPVLSEGRVLSEGYPLSCQGREEYPCPLRVFTIPTPHPREQDMVSTLLGRTGGTDTSENVPVPSVENGHISKGVGVTFWIF